MLNATIPLGDPSRLYKNRSYQYSMGRVWANYEIVQYIPQTPPIVLVGETHDAHQSRALVEDVVTAEEWGAICVELCSERVERTTRTNRLTPRTTHENHGFDAAMQHADETGTPIALIDVPELVSRVRTQAALKVNSDNESLEALSSSVAVRESGDIPLRDVEDYLDTLRDKYPDVYDIIHGERNKTLAKHIRRVHNWSDGPVLAVVGAAHVIPLVEELWRPQTALTTGYDVTVYDNGERIELSDSETYDS